jgi:hypothetical protein
MNADFIITWLDNVDGCFRVWTTSDFGAAARMVDFLQSCGEPNIYDVECRLGGVLVETR